MTFHILDDARERGLIVPDPEPEDEVEAAIEELLDAVKAMGEWKGHDPPPLVVRHRVYKAAERLREARAGARETNDWRPIESVPKDGTSILAWGPDAPEPYCCFWSDSGDWSEGEWWSRNPTHWRPLPEPPEA